MRKALIGILMVATAATPLWAAPGERVRTARQDGDDSAPRPQRAERQAQRVERQEQRQEQRVERQADRQVQRVDRQQVVQQQQQQVVQQQQQQQQSWRSRNGGSNQGSWQGRRGGDGNAAQTQQSWRDRRGGDRDGGRDAYRQHIEETRAASAGSAAEGSPALQRRAAENQARYERSLRENRRGGDRDGDWRRGDRDGRDWGRNGNWDRRDGRNGWDRNWRNDNRYDWQRYRYTNRNIFRRGGYYAPYRNHRYSRLSIGLILGSAFFGQNYWISDPWHYRLPPAYPGTRWVRYYDDVLLIDVYSGEVIDVIHDFFW